MLYQNYEKEGKASESQIGPLIRSLVAKTPFSIFSEVTSFKIFPKINVKNQEAFVFRNEKGVEGRELDCKLVNYSATISFGYLL